MLIAKNHLSDMIELLKQLHSERKGDFLANKTNDIDELIQAIQDFCEKYSSFIDNLRERKIKKISSEIDNT